MRILIDCSFIDFTRQPTGIPRVVLKYIEGGYRWGEERGIEVVPVVTTKDGLYPVRPIPGESPPDRLLRYLEPDISELPNGSATINHLRKSEEFLSAALIEAGAPKGVARVSQALAGLFGQLAGSRTRGQRSR